MFRPIETRTGGNGHDECRNTPQWSKLDKFSRASTCLEQDLAGLRISVATAAGCCLRWSTTGCLRLEARIGGMCRSTGENEDVLRPCGGVNSFHPGWSRARHPANCEGSYR